VRGLIGACQPKLNGRPLAAAHLGRMDLWRRTRRAPFHGAMSHQAMRQPTAGSVEQAYLMSTTFQLEIPVGESVR